jgi:GDP-L-fucose synthase
MVGSAIVCTLQQQAQNNLVMRSHRELDLCDQASVRAFFEAEWPDQIYLVAAKVGGIHANNTCPAEFICQNLMVQSNVIHQGPGALVSTSFFFWDPIAFIPSWFSNP